ncbi:MAG: multidrug effflux MFS transporter [Anderseniella sp.]
MLTTAKSAPGIATLILVTGLSTLSLNMFIPSLSKIAVTFSADYGLTSVSIAGYLGMTAILQIVIGPLSDRFGRRPVMLTGLLVFILASVGCLLATDIWTFLAFRMLQASVICGAALSPAIVRDMVPARQAASLLGYISMAMAVAPMLGPMFGGALDELFGWRASFVAFVGIGMLVFGLCWIDLGETNHHRSDTFADQFTTYPELLSSKRFWGYSLCMAFSTGAFYAFLAGVPLVAKSLFAMSTGTLGIYIGSITGGFFVGSFLSGRYAKRYHLTSLMIAGRVAACAGLSAGLVIFLAGYVHELFLFGATIFVGIGNGLTMPSSSVGAMSVRPRLAGSAAGLSGALTVAGGAIITFATTAVLNEQNGVYVLFAMMLLCSALGLLAALAVRWLDHRDARNLGLDSQQPH